jgi:hypothetical protein
MRSKWMVGQLEDPGRNLPEASAMKPVENSDQDEEIRVKRRWKIIRSDRLVHTTW